MKRYGLIAILTVVVAVIVSVFMIAGADKAKTKYAKYPEPSNKNVPKHVKWNPDKGEYYNGEAFWWDAKQNRYQPVVTEQNKSVASSENIYDRMQKWMEEHQNSNNNLDRALLLYYRESENYTRNHPEVRLKSYYDPNDDPSLSILTNLGEGYLQEMLDRIDKDDVWAGTLMHTAARISKIKMDSYVSVSPEGRGKWLKEFKMKRGISR